MDNKRAFIGIFLIVLVTFLMPYYMRWITGEDLYKPADITADSTQAPAVVTKTEEPAKEQPVLPDAATGELTAPETDVAEPRVTGIATDSVQKTIYIDNGVVKAGITNADGGNFTQWELKKYDYYQGGNLNLITHGDKTSQFGNNGIELELVDRDGQRIELDKYMLQSDFNDGTTIVLDENNPSQTVDFYLPIKGGRVVKQYVFHYNSYAIDVLVRFENLQKFVGNRWYSFGWENGLLATEENAKDDYTYARAYVSLGGELENLNISDEETERMEKSGQIDWTAIRTKYFLAAIIPHTKDNLSVTLSGTATKEDEDLVKLYSTSLNVAFSAGDLSTSVDSFTVYLGPMSISDLEPFNVGLESLVMSKDWYERLFSPISRWIILPSFTALHKLIPNYGFVIIIFSILIKLLLHPLTRKSYESMSKMQVIQPKMTEMREKYQNDPQRLNREMMKMYKEEGVNPLGGCLPMLLQMPLLFALFIVFRSTIQLRGEPFVLWITDLSRPDMLALPFDIPYLGSVIHVLPFLMGITMIWQSKMTMTDPKQKMMAYFMPVFMIFIFYSLPSGLNLYYAIFNFFSMIQTRLIKKKTTAEAEQKAKKTVKPADKKQKNSSPKSVKEALAKRRSSTPAQGNRAQRRQSKRK